MSKMAKIETKNTNKKPILNNLLEKHMALVEAYEKKRLESLVINQITTEKRPLSYRN